MAETIILKDPEAHENTYQGINRMRAPDGANPGSLVEFIKPNGSLQITQNGTYDVMNLASVSVNFLSWTPGGRY